MAGDDGVDLLLRRLRVAAGIVFLALCALVVIVEVAGPFIQAGFQLDNVFIATLFTTFLVIMGLERLVRIVNRDDR